MLLATPITIICIIGNLLFTPQQISTDKSRISEQFTVTNYSHKDLLKWEKWGTGIIANGSHQQLIMSETEGSKGIMIVSPDIYHGDVILSYDVMTLRAATVVIVELFAHNTNQYDLTLPADYDGNVKYLFENVAMYMLSFHNAPHNKPGPFIRKYPEPGKEPLVKSNQRFVKPGIYHSIELGKIKHTIYLNIDGINVLETEDNDMLQAGKIVLRIRGTAHEHASCLIRNVKIYHKE
jgi:hypothetical protein